jgi:hypothetical protein
MTEEKQPRKRGRKPLVHLWRDPDGVEHELTCEQVAERCGVRVTLAKARATMNKVNRPMPGGWALVRRGAPLQRYGVKRDWAKTGPSPDPYPAAQQGMADAPE